MAKLDTRGERKEAVRGGGHDYLKKRHRERDRDTHRERERKTTEREVSTVGRRVIYKNSYFRAMRSIDFGWNSTESDCERIQTEVESRRTDDGAFPCRPSSGCRRHPSTDWAVAECRRRRTLLLRLWRPKADTPNTQTHRDEEAARTREGGSEKHCR